MKKPKVYVKPKSSLFVPPETHSAIIRHVDTIGCKVGWWINDLVLKELKRVADANLKTNI